ncbi:hypothetical protein T440DRAFT_473405 [Plenodomus tracheiphilus IPT5]|uniref:Uncharacterized protein n=1 Tax=Plenodomus tracheiphilus IPT5 TaxID=1408161 RepID=A0A6A7AMZ3_9PLEO|nr:hypothetical protein T440DRAFT_473405 [Plenodomus tracheiphilus IPT5]
MECNRLSSQAKQQLLSSPDPDIGGLDFEPINPKKRKFDRPNSTKPVNQTSNSTDSFEFKTCKSWKKTPRSRSAIRKPHNNSHKGFREPSSQKPAMDRPRSAPLATPLLAPSQGSRIMYASSGAFRAQQQHQGLQKTSSRTHHDHPNAAPDNQVTLTDANSTSLHHVRYSLGTLENPQYCPRQVVSTEFRLLQCDAAAGLLGLFFPHHTTAINELALLKGLTDLWEQGRSLFCVELSTDYDSVSTILELWLRERQVINDLYRSMQAGPSFKEENSVNELQSLNEIRAIRLHLINFRQFNGQDPGDLLCKAFGVLTNIKGYEDNFKTGLAKLASELDKSKLLDSLDKDNSKITNISVNRNEPSPIPGTMRNTNSMPPSIHPQYEPAGSSGTFNKPIVIDKGESTSEKTYPAKVTREFK